MEDSRKDSIWKFCLTFGKFKFLTNQAIFDDLVLGESVAKRKYSYRIKPERIVACIQYLQGIIPVIPGRTRNVKIDGHILHNMPVYSLGGKNRLTVFNSYRLLHPNKESSIGRDNFLKFSKMLCEKREIKTGLSSYVVCVREVGHSFEVVVHWDLLTTLY